MLDIMYIATTVLDHSPDTVLDYLQNVDASVMSDFQVDDDMQVLVPHSVLLDYISYHANDGDTKAEAFFDLLHYCSYELFNTIQDLQDTYDEV